MALKYSAQKIILREVELNNLPPEALAVSPHATVPSLDFGESKFINESWDIVKWALQQNDPHNWLGKNNEYLQQAEMLVEINDFLFKVDLDHYKYADRYPEYSMQYYRLCCEQFLEALNQMLEQNTFLISESMSIADVALFPFIRQFALVDKAWFDGSPYTALQRWLVSMLDTEWFKEAFKKRVIWESGSENVYL
jgi:glutathione S-transferase